MIPQSASPEVDVDVDVEALWLLCLEIVRRRRLGQPPPIFPAGSALAWHSASGFAVAHGSSPEAVDLFELLKPVLDQTSVSAPYVIGQLGQSLDGCIATHNGDSRFVNGPEVLTHLHRLRALCDAVIVGAGTAAIDNPQLTTRHVAGEHPVRVVLDPALTLSPALKVFSDRQAPTWLVCDAKRSAEAADRVGIDHVLGVPGFATEGGRLSLPALIETLAQRGLRVLFVEGGGISVSRFIEQGCLDRLHLSIAPVIIGGGRPGLQLPRHAAMSDCPRPQARVFQRGADVLWDLDLRASASKPASR